MEIQGLLSSIGTAVQEAHRAIEDYSCRQFFDDYFEKTGDASGAYQPRLMEIHLPGAGTQSKPKVVYAPVAALVQNRNLHLDTVKLNLNVEVTEDKKDGLRVASLRGASNGAGGANGTGETTHSGVLEITFRCADAPEGIARVETQLNAIL